MHRYRSRLRWACVAAALAVLASGSPADAHSGHGFSVSLSSSARSAYSNRTVVFTMGAVEPDTMYLDFPAGWRFAHADGYGNELFANPETGNVIGTGTQTASWSSFFCGTGSQQVTWKWSDNMANSPVLAVAHWTMTVASVGTADAWVIEQNDAADDYEIVIEFNESFTCASSYQPAGAETRWTLYGVALSGAPVQENPATTGTYTITADVLEVGGTYHTGTTTATIT